MLQVWNICISWLHVKQARIGVDNCGRVGVYLLLLYYNQPFFKDPQPPHERIHKVYNQLSHYRDAEQITSWRDQVLARLRSGYQTGLRTFMHRLGPQIDETCYICGEGQITLVHWILDFPRISAERITLFGTHRGRLEWLCEEPLHPG